MDRIAIIYVHGNMGSVKQFVPLINLLQSKSQIDQYNISLPGHDGTISDFKSSNRFAWQQCVNDKISELREEYDGLILVGHSMGGLLLINAAIECPDKIKAVITISLPLYVKITVRAIKIRILCIGKVHDNENESISAARGMNGVLGITLFNSYKLFPSTLGLFQLMRETKKILHSLTVPLTIIHSANDEIVSTKTVCFAQKVLPGVSVVPLEQASHFWFPSSELDMIKEQIDFYCVK